MPEFLQFELLWGLNVRTALEFLGIIVLGLAASFVVNLAFQRIDRHLGPGSYRHAIIQAFNGPVRWGILVAALWGACMWVLRHLTVSVELQDLEWGTFLATELPFVLWFSLRLTDNLTTIWESRAEDTDGTFDDQLVPVIRATIKIVLVVIVLMMIVQNLGGDVSSLLAGFGIGGAAVALASKDTIANLFGSIVIFVDRPFQIGDWVEIGDHEGTVEQVGLRVTRIRTFSNSLITIPNASLTTTAINNWSKMMKRRIRLTIGVTYDSTPDQIAEAVEAIRDVLRSDDRISQDFFLVNFNNLGDSSLEIFVYCFTITTRWDEYMQVRQEVLLEFMRRISGLGLEFAFPTQTVHVAQLPNSAPAHLERQLPR